MATTSFLYHTMGVKGYRHCKTEYVGDVVRHHVKLRRFKRRCRGCRARWHEVTLAGRYERTLVSVPIGRRRQEIVLHGHFQRCRRCGRRLREPVYFTKGAQRYTRSVGDYVLYLCEKATIKDVAEIVGMGWDTVKGIFKSHLRRQLQRQPVPRALQSAPARRGRSQSERRPLLHVALPQREGAHQLRHLPGRDAELRGHRAARHADTLTGRTRQ